MLKINYSFTNKSLYYTSLSFVVFFIEFTEIEQKIHKGEFWVHLNLKLAAHFYQTTIFDVPYFVFGYYILSFFLLLSWA